MPSPGARGSAAGTLELRDLTKVFQGTSRPAVDGVSLTVPSGSVCVLIGPSGCGKTTTMRMVNRLIDPTSGDVLIGGRPIRDIPAPELRRGIGYVIQHVGLMPHLTVAANVQTVPRLLGWDTDVMAARTGELLHLVGLDPGEYAHRYPAELSGGQQQRVGLARALAADPPVMLMDEPFSAVDPITRERLQNDFLRLHRALPKTVVFVSHDIDEAVKMADLIVIMREGRVVRAAAPAVLLADPGDAFVADFVGADRALKSLGLLRLEEIPLRPVPAVAPGTEAGVVARRIADDDLETVDGSLLVVAHGRALGWTPLDRVEREGAVPEEHSPSGLVVLDRVGTLRDALSALLGAGVMHGVVADADGQPLGLVSVDEIAAALPRSVPVGDG
jgi:osmoprotectant transport system ATP-binding protein